MESNKLYNNNSSKTVCGKVLIPIYENKYPQLHYGDEIIVRGQLVRPKGLRNPEGFDYRSYLSGMGIHAILKVEKEQQIQTTGKKYGNLILGKIIYPARRYTIETICKTTTGSSRHILAALLTGEKSQISSEIRESFSNTGIIHVLAISGLHVGYVLLILKTLLGFFRFPHTTQTLLTITALIFFALLTEARPPVVRASIMAGAYLIGTVTQRHSNPFNILGTAALVILLLRPNDIFNAGFQLSFSAVISIVYFYQKLRALPFIIRFSRIVCKNTILKNIFNLFLVSLSAQLGILPLTAYYFNRVPLLSIVVNIFAIPLVGLIVALGFTMLFTNMFSSWIASVYGALNQELLSILQKIVIPIGKLPFSHIDVATPHPVLIFTYYCILLLIFNISRPQLKKCFTILTLIGLNLHVWTNVLWNDSTKFTWIQFDVGQGDASLLRLPRKKNILIDGGERNPYFDCGARILAPYLQKKGIQTLDAVIISHPHNDHIGGLITILNQFKVRKVICADTPFQSNLNHQLQEVINLKQIPVTIVSSGDSLNIFPGIMIKILSPAPTKTTTINPAHGINNRSVVLRLYFGTVRFLFMGDAETETENYILRSHHPLLSHGIKIGHHGSISSSSPHFLSNVQPKISVISVGKNNRFNHPSEIVLTRLKALKSKVYRTDHMGAIIIKSDGKTLKQVKWK
jgi:competence protein ComEC